MDWHLRRFLFASRAAALCGLSVVLVAAVPEVAAAARKACRLRNMVSIEGQYCIDRYESSVQYKAGRSWKMHSPFESVAGLEIRAVSRPGVYPQAYISRNEAETACLASGKRLCTEAEWVKACKGRRQTRWPYGNDHVPGACNDAGVSPLNYYYGERGGVPETAYGWGPMNDPRLNQLPGSLARTGQFQRCRSSYGVHDMVGNLHEWIAALDGTFRGGYYLDTHINGDGCDYKTVAHNAVYHDYSTGFRCCADLR